MISGKTKGSIFTIFIFLFLSCGKQNHPTVCNRLQKWDTQLAINPGMVRDSLKMIDPKVLSDADHAYFDLIKVISDDKLFVEFTSDSLITSVENYYRRHEPNSNSHIRSLIYQGIVRYRMGIKDSTVILPLQEAKKNLLPSERTRSNTRIFHSLLSWRGINRQPTKPDGKKVFE